MSRRCRRSRLVDVAEGGGIGLTFAAGTGNKLVYCTTQNGDVLYLAASLPEAITSYTLAIRRSAACRRSRNLAPLPTGHIVRYWRGRLRRVRQIWLGQFFRAHALHGCTAT